MKYKKRKRLKKAVRRAERDETYRIERSYLTYLKDQFHKQESKLLALFNKRFNFDGKVDIRLFNYYPAQIKKELKSAISQKIKTKFIAVIRIP